MKNKNGILDKTVFWRIFRRLLPLIFFCFGLKPLENHSKYLIYKLEYVKREFIAHFPKFAFWLGLHPRHRCHLDQIEKRWHIWRPLYMENPVWVWANSMWKGRKIWRSIRKYYLFPAPVTNINVASSDGELLSDLRSSRISAVNS